MSTCAIRYRFDGPGPASFLVEHGGVARVCCRGVLSAPLTDGQVRAMLGDGHRRWVAATGEVLLDVDSGADRWLNAAGPVPIEDGVIAVESA